MIEVTSVDDIVSIPKKDYDELMELKIRASVVKDYITRESYPNDASILLYLGFADEAEALKERDNK